MEHKITQKNHKYSIISIVEKSQVPFLYSIISKAQCVLSYKKLLDRRTFGSQPICKLETFYVIYVAKSQVFKHYTLEDPVGFFAWLVVFVLFYYFANQQKSTSFPW